MPPPTTTTTTQQPQTTNHHHHHNHRQSPPHPHYRSSQSSKASFRGCCCCLFLLFSFLFLLVIAVLLVIFLAVKPKKPQFDLQQVAVQYVGISSSQSSSSASLSLNIRLIFTAANMNKVGIKYGESRFTVMYRGIPLGKAIVPGFYQPAKSERKVVSDVVVNRVDLVQADAASELIKDAELNDRVELRILGDVGAKIRVLDFTSPAVHVSVDCAIVISPKKQSLTYKQCGFDGVSV